ncbi:MAG: succinate dehydrogenase cytochrome b subunit [Bacteroidia bacterium]
MNWVTHFLKSSIGRKFLMALTGLFLCTFLVVHLIGNLQLLKSDGGLAFNAYAVFMTSNPLIKTISYGLYAIILFHAFWGLYLVSQNKKARPQAYAVVDGSANSKWTSRWMGVLGTIILAFIVMHMSSFWAEYHFSEMPYVQYEQDLVTGDLVWNQVDPIETKMEQYVSTTSGSNPIQMTTLKNLYWEVQEAFQVWWIVLLYVLAMAAIAFHLVHGFSSAFQTLGINHSKYNGLIRFIGVGVFGIIIPILFALIPVYFFMSSL